MPASTRNDQTAFINRRLAEGPAQRDALVEEALPFVNPEVAASAGSTYLTITNPANRVALNERKRTIVMEVLRKQIAHGILTESSSGVLYRLPNGYSSVGRRIDILPLEDIDVGTRLRDDLGDCKSLAASIDVVGLLHPIIVVAVPDNPRAYRLAAGARRLEAFRLLERPTIPARVFDLPDGRDLDAYAQVLDAVENVERLTPGVLSMRDMQKVLDDHLAEWRAEAKQAGERGGRPKGTKNGSRSATTISKSKQDRQARTTVKVAQATGLSEREAAILTELHDRAVGTPRKGDPKDWKVSFGDMQVAQGLIGRIERGEKTYKEALRELRQWIKEQQGYWRRDLAAAAQSTTTAVDPVPPPDPDPAPPPNPVPVPEPPPDSEPTVSYPQLVVPRPLDATAAKTMWTTCTFQEIEVFVKALIDTCPVAQRARIRQAVCGDN